MSNITLPISHTAFLLQLDKIGGGMQVNRFIAIFFSPKQSPTSKLCLGEDDCRSEDSSFTEVKRKDSMEQTVNPVGNFSSIANHFFKEYKVYAVEKSAFYPK